MLGRQDVKKARLGPLLASWPDLMVSVIFNIYNKKGKDRPSGLAEEHLHLPRVEVEEDHDR